MKALRFHAAKDLRLDTVTEPQDIPAGNVLVRVLQCGICGSDLHEYTDGPQLIPTTPHPFTGARAPQILGHEFSAIIEAVGPEVKTVAVGQRVSIVPHLNVPGEYFARRNLGHVSNETALIGFSWAWGGLGELAIVPEQNCVPLPDSLSDAEGALVEPASVALNAVDLAKLQAGSTVLVTGAGPIGALVALCALASGASAVVVSDPNQFRLSILQDLPGVFVADGSAEQIAQFKLVLTEGGRGFDAAFECAGHEGALNAAISSVRPTGTVVQVGLFVKPPRVDCFKISEKALSYLGSWGFPITIGPRVVALIQAKLLPVERIVTKKIGLDDVIKEGFDELIKPGHSHLKILVDVAAGGDRK